MYRLLAALLLVVTFLSTGCCHCYQRTYYPGRGPIAAAVAAPVRAVVGCSKGCGDVYWGEWTSDPPDDCDPCCGGQFVGPRDCCGSQCHTRLCIWGILESARGIRGTCGGGGCCEGGCGDGGCSAGSCGGGGADWSHAHAGEYSGEYAGAYVGQNETHYAPEASSEPLMPSRSMPAGTGTYNDPAWNRPTPRVAPGVPTPTGRRPSNFRSVQSNRGRPPIRSVGYEEEVEAKVSQVERDDEVRQAEAPVDASARQAPALLEDVLPDPRANYRR